mgnify:CR=1 FL=1
MFACVTFVVFFICNHNQNDYDDDDDEQEKVNNRFMILSMYLCVCDVHLSFSFFLVHSLVKTGTINEILKLNY